MSALADKADKLAEEIGNNTCSGSQTKVDESNRSKMLPSQAFCPGCGRTVVWNQRTGRIPRHKIAPKHPKRWPKFREYP